MSTETAHEDEFEFESAWPRGGAPEERAERDEGKVREIWWAVRWHAGITFVGTPMHFLAAVKDGARAFRREFARTFSQRWTHSEREEAYQRFVNVK